MRKLKVYGASSSARLYGNRKHGGRVIVAATTKKRAMELVGINSREFSTYWSETRNERELAIATVEGAWMVKDDNLNEIEPIKIT